jgi:hypothetical protein
MAWTYTTLKAAIQSFTENDSTEFSDALDNIIHLAEDRIYREADLEVFRSYDTSLSFSSGTNTLTISSLSPRPFVVRWINIKTVAGTTKYILDKKDDSYIREFWPSTTLTAQPRFYAAKGDGIIMVAPTPDATYNVELAYTYKPTSIVTAATSWLGTYAEELLFYACMAEAYIFMKGEKQAMEIWEFKYKQALMAVTGEQSSDRRGEYRPPGELGKN